jgi:hypothetical protein
MKRQANRALPSPTMAAGRLDKPTFLPESRMLRAAVWEVFEWLFILAVLIGAVVGVAIYTTAWLMLLPARLALAPRGHCGEIQPLQD